MLITVDAAESYPSDRVDRTVPENVSVNYNYYQTTPTGILQIYGRPNTPLGTYTQIYNMNQTGFWFLNGANPSQGNTVNHHNIDEYNVNTVIYLINQFLGK